ncbi:MAG: hydroxymethylbilane synthase [Streptosporangiales bacterium]
MSESALRIGTRRSKLARAQTQLVADALARVSDRPVEFVDVTTEGDTSRASLTQLGGAGVFVGALRERLLAGDVDLAVHSLKDLPTARPSGLAIAAMPERDDPRDALVGSATLVELPAGARVGTGSPRRAAQLRAARPDLDVVDIRGNIDSRIARVTGGPGAASADRLDAVVLAYAGLRRLGRAELVREVFPPATVLPAPGQGALAVECRAADADAFALAAAVDHADTRAAASAERALLAALEAGCAAPVGALARVAATGHLELDGAVFAVDGKASIGRSANGPPGEPERLGRVLAEELLACGAEALMGEQVS